VFAKKITCSEDAAKKLTDKINVLSESEKRFNDIESKNFRLMKEKERLIEELKKSTQTMETEDISNKVQRQRIEELETLINTYEKRFLAKGVDVPKRTFDLF
jgi:hypothetical protein